VLNDEHLIRGFCPWSLGGIGMAFTGCVCLFAFQGYWSRLGPRWRCSELLGMASSTPLRHCNILAPRRFAMAATIPTCAVGKLPLKITC